MAFRSAATAVQYTASASSSHGITIPGDVQPGDTLTFAINIALATTTYSTPTGWTLTGGPASGASMTGLVFTRIAQSGDAGATVNFVASTAATAKWAGVLVAHDSTDATTQYDVAVAIVGAAASASKVTPATAAAVTTGGDVLEIVMDKGSPSSPSFTQPSGWTVLSSSYGTGTGSPSIAVAEAPTASTSGTTEGGDTWTGSSLQYVAATIIIRPGSAPPPTPGTVVQPAWEPQAAGAEFAIGTAGCTAVRLSVSAHSDLSSPVYTSSQVAPDGDGYVRFTATGMAPGTRYYWGLTDQPSGGAETAIYTTRRCATLPGTGPQDFTMTLSACIETGASDGTALLAMQTFDADLNIFTGDLDYVGQTSLSYPAHIATKMAQYAAVPNMPHTWSDLGFVTLDSDHDAGPDNGPSNLTDAPYMAAASQAMQVIYPTSTLADTRSPRHGLYRAIPMGRVKVIILDVRNFDRSTVTSTGTGTDTLLGATQLAWLKTELADPDYPVKFIVMDTAWMGANDNPGGAPVKGDWAPAYPVERQAIIDYIAATPAVGYVMLGHGDTHAHGHATATKNTWGNFPVFCAGGVYQIGGGRDLTTFSSYWNNSGGLQQAYGRFTFSDDGSTISYTWEAFDAVGGTVVDTFSDSIDTAQLATGTVTASGTLSGARTNPATAAAIVTALGSATPAGTSLSLAATVTANGVLSPVQQQHAAAVGTVTASGTVSPAGVGTVITVTSDPTNKPPRMVIEVDGAAGASVTVTRIDPAGNTSPVRAFNPKALAGGGALDYDYEAPFGVPVTYLATFLSGAPVASAVVTLTPVPYQSWLTHAGIPDLSQPIVIASIGTRTRTTNAGTFQPIGRANALTRTDGVRRSPTFPLNVQTYGSTAEKGLETLLADASSLLLQVANDGRLRTLYTWVSIGDVTDDDLTDGYPDDPYLLWALPCTVVDPPSGLLQSQRTLGSVEVEFDTLGAIYAAYASLRDVITDTLIGS